MEEPWRPPEGPPPGYRPEPRIRNWIILLALGVVFLVFGIVMILGGTKAGVTYKKVTFTTRGFEAEPITISGLLLLPNPPVGGQRPGVVFAHGITGSKEWYVQMEREIARDGFPVLAIDLRGHGGSGGYSTYGNDEVAEIWAAAEYLRKNVPEADPKKIVAMGHSLGGISVTRAGALQKDGSIQGVIAIWCWSSLQDALVDLMGPIDNFVGRAWGLTAFSRHTDITAPGTLGKYNALDLVNDTMPPNYLLECGRNDELASEAVERQVMEKATAVIRGGQELKLGFTYGDMGTGNARRLTITDDDHVTELVGGVLTFEAIDWLKNLGGIPLKANDRPPFLWGRILGIICLVAALLLLSLGAMSLVRWRMFPEGGEIDIEPAWEPRRGEKAFDVLLYAAPVLAASYLALPAAKALGIGPFIPYEGIGEMSIFWLTRTLLLLPLLSVLLFFVARSQGGLSGIKSRLKSTASRWGRSVAYGLIPLAVCLLVLVVLAGPLVLPRVFAKLPLYFFVGLACLSTGFWIEDYLFYRLAYPALRSDIGDWWVILVRALVLDLALILTFLPLFDGLGIAVKFQAFRIPLLLLMALAVPMFAIMAKVSLRMRELTGGNLAFSLMLTGLLVWFLTGPVGVRGF